MRIKHKIIILTLLALVLGCGLPAQARVPRKPVSTYDQGVEAFENAQYQQTIDLMNEVLVTRPDNGYALAYKGSAQRMLDRPGEAATTLGRAVPLIDDVNSMFRAWVHSERFFALIELGDTVAALDEVNLALADHEHARYYENRAIVYGNLGNYDAALADYDRALALEPDNTELIEERKKVADVKDYFENRDNSTYTYYERDVTAGDEVTLPLFPGGNDAMTDYISRQTGWDQVRQSQRVVVEVAVDETGKITDAKISKGINSQLDKKALEICRAMPNFVPATYQGKAIKSILMIPVRF